MNYKRAQVPLLILALAVGLLIYVYFLPLSEKCKIINMPECTKLAGKLFSVSPGIIELKENKTEYTIPDVELFTVGGRDVNILAEMIQVRRGWFTSYSPKLSFEIHENSKEARFFIYLTEDKKAKVKINGETIQVVKGVGQHIITIPSMSLQKSNVIEIYPTVPFFPWNVNKLNVGKVIYEESYTVTQEKVTHSVNIKEEVNDIKKATLSFRSNCFMKDSNLTIILNNTEIVNDVVCKDLSVDVTSILKKSMNISFFSKGNYLIYNIRLKLELKQETWPTYYFDLLEERKYNVLKVKFAETGQKKLTVYLNEKSFAIETSDMEWQTDVTNYLVIGQNKLVIIPSQTVNIQDIGIY
jgi:hypothetical protein